MKNITKLNIVLPSLLLLFTLTGMAQNTENNTGADNNYFSLTFGLNMIDNSNKSILPFDGGELHVNTPFFLTAEKKFHKNWSVALTLTTNQLKLENPAVTEPYFSTDIFANWFVDDLIFNNENIDLYMGLGAGIHTLHGESAESFNLNSGFRYWFSDQWAVNVQAIGKLSNHGIPQVDSHYQFNLGMAFKFPNKKQKGSDKDQADAVSTNTEPVVQDPIENLTESDKEVKNRIPKYDPNISVTSTDLAKTPLEKDKIKKNAATILNTTTLNTRPDGVQKGFHVIIYAFRIQNNLDNMLRGLSEKGIDVQVIRVAQRNLTYISIAHFNTSEEAYDYIDHTLGKDTYEGTWVYEVD